MERPGDRLGPASTTLDVRDNHSHPLRLAERHRSAGELLPALAELPGTKRIFTTPPKGATSI